MKKNDKQVLLRKIADYEERCDDFLQSLQDIEILNLNYDTPQESVIDTHSPELQIFCNDIMDTLKQYPKYFENNFEYLIQKVKCLPNHQNISDLKIAMHSLKYRLEDLPDNFVKNDIWAFIHPQILQVSKQRFIDGYYADAVESAFKEINTRVKRLYQMQTGEEKDGSDLMRNAFSPKNPILKFESLDSQSGKSIQQGYMDIFAGAMTGIRNPKAHENVTISDLQAVQILMFASLLMSKIDEAVNYTGIEE